jgi:hypothetical protein
MGSLHLTDFDKLPLHVLLRVLALALVVLALSAASAVGDAEQIVAVETDESQPVEEVASGSDEQDETVTMAIDLEEGGTIDLEMARGDVVIDSWDGDEVLVIVEKMSKTGSKSGSPQPHHINFKVSRQGNNVRIAALDNDGRRVNDVDFSFRIVVPKDRHSKKVERAYDLSKLTAVIFKALHREALNWLVR